LETDVGKQANFLTTLQYYFLSRGWLAESAVTGQFDAATKTAWERLCHATQGMLHLANRQPEPHYIPETLRATILEAAAAGTPHTSDGVAVTTFPDGSAITVQPIEDDPEEEVSLDSDDEPPAPEEDEGHEDGSDGDDEEGEPVKLALDEDEDEEV
jgi:hypothetical protein